MPGSVIMQPTTLCQPLDCRSCYLPLQAQGQLVTGRISGLTAARVLFDDVRASSVMFDNCDLSSLRWSDSKLSLVVFRTCKIMGGALDGLALDDVLFEGCKPDYTAFSKVRATGPVAFTGGTLTEATFADCDLSGSSSTTARCARPSSTVAFTRAWTCAATTCPSSTVAVTYPRSRCMSIREKRDHVASVASVPVCRPLKCWSHECAAERAGSPTASGPVHARENIHTKPS
ncbi:pentapeptide repeat-containing protein [Streptomyces sp. NPDC002221]|uniref:pentapeptide repeat-containing protein n=1 Tax=Streptomyces sp. NPDC002221 TaxID=3364639 RepID=UPI003677D3D4